MKYIRYRNIVNLSIYEVGKLVLTELHKHGCGAISSRQNNFLKRSSYIIDEIKMLMAIYLIVFLTA